MDVLEIKNMAKAKIYQCKESAYGKGTQADNRLEGDFGEWEDWEKVLVQFAIDVLKKNYDKTDGA